MTKTKKDVHLDNRFLEALIHDLKRCFRVQTQYLEIARDGGKNNTGDSILISRHLETMITLANKGTEILEAAQKVIATPEKEYSLESLTLESALNEVTGLIDIMKKYDNINIVKDYKAHCSAYTDKSRLYRVFLNIFANANDALSGQTKKEIKIKTFDDNQYSYIQIDNNGPYITIIPITKIFKSFTTSTGKGHGIGLSSCKKYLLETKGDITVENLTKEQGVRFTIKLPRTEEIYKTLTYKTL